MELKPFFVTLKVTAVVMASSDAHAMTRAESFASRIVSDGQLSSDSVENIESLQELSKMDPEWTGDCIPYGGDGVTRLDAMLPNEPPLAKDVHTIDMFDDIRKTPKHQ